MWSVKGLFIFCPNSRHFQDWKFDTFDCWSERHETNQNYRCEEGRREGGREAISEMKNDLRLRWSGRQPRTTNSSRNTAKTTNTTEQHNTVFKRFLNIQEWYTHTHTHTAGGGKLMTFWMWFSVMEAKKGQCEIHKRKNADFLIPLNS